MLLLALAGSASARAAGPVEQPRGADDMRLGVPSYWGSEPGDYAVLPAGSLALVNPSSGVLVSRGQAMSPVATLGRYRRVVKAASGRGVIMEGYVPTGYFRHDCNAPGKCQQWDRIEAQVRTYFEALPSLSGIFFDETASPDGDCDAYAAEYERLRSIVHRHRPSASITFNPGMADPCVVKASKPGETIVIFEGDPAAYAAREDEIAAAERIAGKNGIRTWHLLHSVPDQAAMKALAERARRHGADWFYATDVGGNWQAGDDTWGAPPPYWTEQVVTVHTR